MIPLRRILLTLLLFVACRPAGRTFGPAHPTHDRDTVLISNGSEPKSIDPGLVDESSGVEIAQNCFEGLTTFQPKTPLQPGPGMAEKWEVLDGGLRYVFHLRQANWNDGHPVTANDFVYAWQRVLSPELASQYAYQLWYLAGGRAYNEGKVTDPNTVGVHALDDRTLEVRLEKPTPFFLFITSTPTLAPVPRWVVEKWGNHWTRPEHIVVNGPYKVVRWRIQDEIVVEKNDRYWDAAHVQIKRVVAISDDDTHSVLDLYRSGEVDTTSPNSTPPISAVPELRKSADYTEHPFLATYWYWFNARRPPFNDARVRRAFSMAVDKKRLMDSVCHGVHQPSWSVVPDIFGNLSGYRPPLGPMDRYDPEAARKLLAEAGYPEGKGFPVTKLMFNPDDQHRIIAEAIQGMWQDVLGVHVDILNVEWKVMLAQADQGDFDIIREGWQADYPEPSTFLTVFLSDGGENNSGWKSPEYDRILKEALSEGDQKRRNELYAKAERILLDDMPAMPIYLYSKYALSAVDLDGMDPNPLDIHLYKYFHWR